MTTVLLSAAIASMGADLARTAGGFRLPQHDGMVDRTGASDATDGLQRWLNAGVAAGDPLFLPAGVYKTSDELVVEGGADVFLMGAGAQRSLIHARGRRSHGLRVHITANQFRKAGLVQGIGLLGPAANASGALVSALPANGKAGLVLDSTKLLTVRDVEAAGFDIGFDLIRNCYNSVFYDISTPRFASVNCAINLREGVQSGSDLCFFNTQLHAERIAVNIMGDGGNYHFFGGQWSAQDARFAANDDERGVLTIGRAYDARGGGRIDGGAHGIMCQSIAMEGWKGIWAIRTYDEFSLMLQACSYLASHAGRGEQALGLMKSTDPKNSTLVAHANRVGGGYFAASADAVCSLGGVVNDDFCYDESIWSSGAAECDGERLGPMWFGSIGRCMTRDRGFAKYVDRGAAAVQTLGRAMLRGDYDGPLQKSNDAGASWSEVT